MVPDNIVNAAPRVLHGRITPSAGKKRKRSVLGPKTESKLPGAGYMRVYLQNHAISLSTANKDVVRHAFRLLGSFAQDLICECGAKITKKADQVTVHFFAKASTEELRAGPVVVDSRHAQNMAKLQCQQRLTATNTAKVGIVRNSAQDLADATGQSVSAPQGLSQLSLAENTARYMFFETCALVGISLNQVDTLKARAPGFAQWGSAAIAEWADPACQIHRRDRKVMLAGKAVHLVFDSSTVHGRQLLAWVAHFIDENMQL